MSELDRQLDKRSPAVEYELVDVTFDSADTDVEIKTGLRPLNPEAIHVQVLDASGPPLIYRDTSASRVKWSTGLIRLRSAIAGLKATLLLTVPLRDFAPIDGGSKVIAKGLLPASIAYKDVANVFSENQTIERNLASWAVKHSGFAYTRFASFADNGSHFTSNLYFDGSVWNLDDTAQRGLALIVGLGGGDPGWSFQGATAGANPRTLTEVIRVMATGGIRFPAVQVASSDANTLDDYEEGVFTPTLGGSGGTTVAPTYQVQSGWYIKVGRVAFVWGAIVLTNKGTINGSIEIKSLPFRQENAVQLFAQGALQWNALATNWVNVFPLPLTNDVAARVRGATAASTNNAVDLAAADLTNTTSFYFTMAFRVTA